MLDAQLREVKERLLQPVVRRVSGQASPMTVTVVGLVFGLGAALAGWQGMYTLGLILWLINRFFDGLDGAIARASGRQTDFGGYVDIMSDFAVYALVPIGLALHDGRSETLIALAFLLGSFYVNTASWMYLSALLERRQARGTGADSMTSITMPGGLIEGAETILFYAAFFIFPQLLVAAFIVMGTMVLGTVFQRIVWARKVL